MLTIVVLALASKSSLAQEVCHWECEVFDCDYYADYCDYDCYEVCYPYLSNLVKFGHSHAHTSPSRKSSNLGLSGATKGGQREQAAAKPRNRENFHGK